MASSTDIVNTHLTSLKKCNDCNLMTAASYYAVMGLKTIKVVQNTKKAYGDGWQEPQYVDGPDHWEFCPGDNIGLPLGRNHLFVVDIDNQSGFDKIMDVIGDTLLEESGADELFTESKTIRISSGKIGSGKQVFMIPPEIEDKLTYHCIRWANQEGREGNMIVEFRCGDARQDVAPPSIHPSGSKYQWIGDSGVLYMPEDLQELVLNWDKYELTMHKVNPNYVAPPKPIFKDGKKYTGINYLDQWTQMQDLRSMLIKYGYKPVGNRFLSPESHSQSPGIVLLDGGTKFYSHGESDFFAQSGKGGKTVHDAYDLLCHFECDDDDKQAWEYIKRDLGVTQETINKNKTPEFWEGTNDW